MVQQQNKPKDMLHRATFNEEEGDLSVVVAEAVAAAKNIPVEELESLNYSINLDALDGIFNPLQSGNGFGAIGQLSFMHKGLYIEVHTSGEVKVFNWDGSQDSE